MNIYYLTDGTHFTINPAKETDQAIAYKAKLRFLLGLNLVSMAKSPIWTVDAIRKLAVGLVPGMTEGKRLSKTELLAKLTELQTAEKNAQAQNLTVFVADRDIDTSLLDHVWAALSQQVEPDDLATYIVDNLERSYKTDTSLVKTGIPNLLKALQRDTRYLENQTAIDRVKRLIYSTQDIRDKQAAINKDYSQAVMSNQADRHEVKVEPVLEYIDRILGDVNADWRDITYAIALATGRRMAEILGGHSTWKLGENGCIVFTGLLKGKGRYVDPAKCPEALVKLDSALGGIPLIDAPVNIYQIGSAEAVLRGIARLEVMGKKDAAHERVNTLYGKAFSSRATGDMIAVRNASNMGEMKNSKGEVIGNEFKLSRDFFAAYKARFCYDYHTYSETEEVFVMNHLHHDDLKATASYRKLKLV